MQPGSRRLFVQPLTASRKAQMELAQRNAKHYKDMRDESVSALDRNQKNYAASVAEADYQQANETNEIWNLGAGAAMPILNFGTIEGQIHAADARQVQALHRYKETVLQALADVETDLSNLSKETNRDAALQDAGKSADQPWMSRATATAVA